MLKKISIKNPNLKEKTADDWVDTREGKKRFTLDLPVSLHKRLKIASAKQEETMSEIICEILDEKLKEME